MFCIFHVRNKVIPARHVLLYPSTLWSESSLQICNTEQEHRCFFLDLLINVIEGGKGGTSLIPLYDLLSDRYSGRSPQFSRKRLGRRRRRWSIYPSHLKNIIICSLVYNGIFLSLLEWSAFQWRNPFLELFIDFLRQYKYVAEIHISEKLSNFCIFQSCIKSDFEIGQIAPEILSNASIR